MLQNRSIKRVLAGLLAAFAFAGMAMPAMAVETDAANFPIGSEQAKSLLLAEATSMQTILKKNDSEQLLVAGLSRMPITLVVCEAIDRGELSLDEQIVVGEFASKISGPTAFLEANEKIAVKDLLKSAAMIGAGDAIVAMALKLFGTDQAAAIAINERMSELKINATITSLSNTDTKLSAADLAVLGRRLADSPSFSQYSAMYLDGITHEDGSFTELANPNRLVKTYPGCIGIATGSSSEAGYCGVFAVKRSESVMIAVVVGAKNSKERFSLAQSLFDFGSSNYQAVRLCAKGDVVVPKVLVSNGTLQWVDLIAQNDMTMLLAKGDSTPDAVYEVPERLNAPFKSGDVLGTVHYVDENGNAVASLNLVAATGCDVAKLADYFRMVGLGWVHA
ncbi:MAG: serine hydrolase [Bacillota bacterium]